MRHRIVKTSLQVLKTLHLKDLVADTPAAPVLTHDWIQKNAQRTGCRIIPLIPGESIEEIPPIVIGHPVSRRFSDFYHRKSPEGFVAIIPGGRIFGEYSNLIITPDNHLLSDVSREFGAQGGRKAEDFSIFHSRIRMPEKKRISGNVAVISTCGSNNFHHWNFDALPRLHLLKKAGLLDRIDRFVINYQGLPFQLQGLDKMGIDPGKIINSLHDPDFFLEAEHLYVPSLPEHLGTISPWVVDFLRETFLSPAAPKQPMPESKLFISRKNAPSRRIINEEEVRRQILGRGFVEFIPEQYTMEECATAFAGAGSLLSVHGSGFSNLPFISPGAKVLDILAPYHQDGYYWMICNRRKATYVALFAEGEHPPDDMDIVKEKVDDDLLIDPDKLKMALDTIS